MRKGGIEDARLYLAESVRVWTNKLRSDITLDEEPYRSINNRISSLIKLTRVIKTLLRFFSTKWVVKNSEEEVCNNLFLSSHRHCPQSLVKGSLTKEEWMISSVAQ